MSSFFPIQGINANATVQSAKNPITGNPQPMVINSRGDTIVDTNGVIQNSLAGNIYSTSSSGGMNEAITYAAAVAKQAVVAVNGVIVINQAVAVEVSNIVIDFKGATFDVQTALTTVIAIGISSNVSNVILKGELFLKSSNNSLQTQCFQFGSSTTTVSNSELKGKFSDENATQPFFNNSFVKVMALSNSTISGLRAYGNPNAGSGAPNEAILFYTGTTSGCKFEDIYAQDCGNSNYSHTAAIAHQNSATISHCQFYHIRTYCTTSNTSPTMQIGQASLPANTYDVQISDVICLGFQGSTGANPGNAIAIAGSNITVRSSSGYYCYQGTFDTAAGSYCDWIGCIAYYGAASGFHYGDTAGGTSAYCSYIACWSIDCNQGSATGGNGSAFYADANATHCTIVGGGFIDDQGTHTQLYGAFISNTSTVADIVFIGVRFSGNLTGPTNWSSSSTATGIVFTSCKGLSISNSSVIAGISPYTFPLLGYDSEYVLTTVGGLTSLTVNGQTRTPMNTIGNGVTVFANQPVVATWATTAPVFEIISSEDQ